MIHAYLEEVYAPLWRARAVDHPTLTAIALIGKNACTGWLDGPGARR